ncbi:hypothetical protein NL529_34025, partial [Klebsiella pneumoniae]|nr:hypothetical protein [Klebsiella pneumoniae]
GLLLAPSTGVGEGAEVEMVTGRSVWHLFKQTGSRWSENNAPRLGAALAFYTMLTMAPLLVISIAIAGWLFGEQAARDQ